LQPIPLLDNKGWLIGFDGWCFADQNSRAKMSGMLNFLGKPKQRFLTGTSLMVVGVFIIVDPFAKSNGRLDHVGDAFQWLSGAFAFGAGLLFLWKRKED
jgi:hypothetical protein